MSNKILKNVKYKGDLSPLGGADETIAQKGCIWAENVSVHARYLICQKTLKYGLVKLSFQSAMTD